jgi:2-polyprenyl-3-methyl-5-hydroxy-6-metoxy-1,4-benzoquinol methylase
VSCCYEEDSFLPLFHSPVPTQWTALIHHEIVRPNDYNQKNDKGFPIRARDNRKTIWDTKLSKEIGVNWPVLLFRKSPLKQNKFRAITGLLGETSQLSCLDIGSDNGVISYLLRQTGGSWKSADLDERAVCSIRNLVGCDAFQIDGCSTGFCDNEFDKVVIVDFLEHVRTDREFICELFRIIKPGGELVVNVPHVKNSLLRKVRLAIGQTDEKHGHVRPGYTLEALTSLMREKFTVISYKTYSKFFSECIDTLITCAISLLKGEKATSQKGLLVTGEDLHQYQRVFWTYSLIYPLVWIFAKLDCLLFWHNGYMLIVKARSDKQ